MCEPAVRHAVIALASIHERFEVGGSVSSHHEESIDGCFALRHYNQAINHLIKPIRTLGKQAADVCLISCLLFACFEVRPLYSKSSAEQLRIRVLSLFDKTDSSRTSWLGSFPYSKWGQDTLRTSIA